MLRRRGTGGSPGFMTGRGQTSAPAPPYACRQTPACAATPCTPQALLRHHCASALIAGGENPKVVQKRLGHKDVMTTLRTYPHLFAEAAERTRDVLDAAWGVPEETGSEAESSAASGRIPKSRRAGAAVSRLRA
ncbi:tyrosine-type recombinase/integrase [Streptomyces sp. Ncost-T10-10d]|uniref:tyrosine-type recombinase/integrase n=1 Tax=Streptomyces sp. Ncost-T10-10d TaxID=1839774 RepID=UPI000B876AF6